MPGLLPLLQVCLFSYGQTGAGKTHTMQVTAAVRAACACAAHARRHRPSGAVSFMQHWVLRTGCKIGSKIHVVLHLQGSRSVEGQGIIPRSISKVRAPLWFAAAPCWPSAARQPSLPLGTWQLHAVVISDGAHHTPNSTNMVV